MFLHVSVILSTEGSASVHAGIPHPLEADTPRSRHPPGSRHPQKQTPLKQTPQKQTPPPQKQTHSPLHSACWEIRSTSGRYASYRNAILFYYYVTNYGLSNRSQKKYVGSRNTPLTSHWYMPASPDTTYTNTRLPAAKKHSKIKLNSFVDF